jgi:hypothetical protein
MRSVIAALALLLAAPAFAHTITDGDKLNGTTWRLWRIDAPELHQTCRDRWPAA